MDSLDKPVRLTAHARGYFERRGFTEAEVAETIRTAPWMPAEAGRLLAEKDFPYGNIWNGVFYTTKRVRPIFVEEQQEIVVVTVYTFYF